MRSRLRRLSLVSSLASLVALSACGSDDDFVPPADAGGDATAPSDGGGATDATVADGGHLADASPSADGGVIGDAGDLTDAADATDGDSALPAAVLTTRSARASPRPR